MFWLHRSAGCVENTLGFGFKLELGLGMGTHSAIRISLRIPFSFDVLFIVLALGIVGHDPGLRPLTVNINEPVTMYSEPW